MALNVGSLNVEFRLEKPAGLDADGYEDMGIEWGSKRFASGNELLRFGTPSATGAWVITMRFRSDIEASWRLVDVATEKSFQISNLGDPDGRCEELRIFAVEAQ